MRPLFSVPDRRGSLGGCHANILLVLACSAFATAIAILVFAVVFRPELLRSERHEQTMRLIDIVGDPEMDQADRAKLVTALLIGRSGTRMGEHHE